MKPYPIKISLTCLTLFVSFYVMGQKAFQGKAYYQSQVVIDMANFGRPGMTEEQKNEMVERMRSRLEKTYILTFNQTESLYLEEEKPQTQDSENNRWSGMMNSFTGGGGPQYKNIKENLMLQEQEFFGKKFLIKDTLPKLDWKMAGETKQIGQYLCFKATAKKTSNEIDFASFRRPTSENPSENAPKEIEIIAWYTMQIPVNQGPNDYWGLPGLILEVTRDRTTLFCSKIILNPEEKEVIELPSKGKEITKAAYDDIVKKKMEELRDSFRLREGGNRGGGDRRRG